MSKDIVERLRHYCYEPEFAEAADTIESLRARVAELEAERNQWMANSRENKLIAEQCNRELTAKDQRIAELEYQLDVVTNNPDDPAYWLHSSKQLLEKS